MSVLYRLHQDQSHGTPRSGKWYARMVPVGVIDTRALADQAGNRVKKFLHGVKVEELPENKVTKRAQRECFLGFSCLYRQKVVSLQRKME